MRMEKEDSIMSDLLGGSCFCRFAALAMGSYLERAFFAGDVEAREEADSRS